MYTYTLAFHSAYNILRCSRAWSNVGPMHAVLVGASTRLDWLPLNFPVGEAAASCTSSGAFGRRVVLGGRPSHAIAFRRTCMHTFTHV